VPSLRAMMLEGSPGRLAGESTAQTRPWGTRKGRAQSKIARLT